MSELIISTPDIQLLPASIIFNNSEEILKSAEKLNEQLVNVVVTDETIKSSKKLVAQVRKQANHIDQSRKDLKSELMKPYLEFEKTVKVILQTVSEGEDIIRKQVRELEEREREEKSDYLFDMIGKRIRHYPLINRYDIDVGKFIEPSYLNKTCSLDKAERDITLTLESVEIDLDTLGNMEHSVELITEYLNGSSVTGAIQAVRARHEQLQEVTEKIKPSTITREREEAFTIQLYSEEDYYKVLEFIVNEGVAWRRVV